MIETLKHVAVNCERNHELMLQHFENQPGAYFRFNVQAGLENIRLDEWKRLSDVQSITVDYLHGFEIQTRLAALTTSLRSSLEHRHTIEIAPPSALVRHGIGIPLTSSGQLFTVSSASATPFAQTKTISETETHQIDNGKLSENIKSFSLLGPQQMHHGGSHRINPVSLSKSVSPPNAAEEALKRLLDAFLARLNPDVNSLPTVRDSKPARHHGTCEWIKGKELSKTWLGDGGHPVLVLVAPPGRESPP